MKKIIYISIVISVCFYIVQRFNNKDNTDRCTNNDCRVIVNFENDVMMDETLFSTVDAVQNENIRKLLTKFDVVELKAVYTNRYDQNGFLKPGIKSSIPGTWQQLIMNDSNKTERLIA